MDLLVQGVYDIQTLKTLQQQNISGLAYDLRGKSLNLIPFHVLKTIIPLFKTHKNYLIFENDKIQTVHSFLSLLGEDKHKFELQFRDNLGIDYYSQVHHAFGWFFSGEGDWRNILKLPMLKTLILPADLQSNYQNQPELWDLVHQRHLEVIIHVNSFAELEKFPLEKNLHLSIDLGKEMEISFRQIDQVRLSNLSLWKSSYESASGQ